jgi:hypothetical protein
MEVRKMPDEPVDRRRTAADVGKVLRNDNAAHGSGESLVAKLSQHLAGVLGGTPVEGTTVQPAIPPDYGKNAPPLLRKLSDKAVELGSEIAGKATQFRSEIAGKAVNAFERSQAMKEELATVLHYQLHPNDVGAAEKAHIAAAKLANQLADASKGAGAAVLNSAVDDVKSGTRMMIEQNLGLGIVPFPLPSPLTSVPQVESAMDKIDKTVDQVLKVEYPRTPDGEAGHFVGRAAYEVGKLLVSLGAPEAEVGEAASLGKEAASFWREIGPGARVLRKAEAEAGTGAAKGLQSISGAEGSLTQRVPHGEARLPNRGGLPEQGAEKAPPIGTEGATTGTKLATEGNEVRAAEGGEAVRKKTASERDVATGSKATAPAEPLTPRTPTGDDAQGRSAGGETNSTPRGDGRRASPAEVHGQKPDAVKKAPIREPRSDNGPRADAGRAPQPVGKQLMTDNAQSANKKTTSTGQPARLREHGLTPDEAKSLEETRAFFKLRPGDKGIAGILIDNDTGKRYRVPSGEYRGPDGGPERGGIPRGRGEAFTSGGRSQANIETHIEGKAAAIMHQNGIKNGTLLSPERPCGVCDSSHYDIGADGEAHPTASKPKSPTVSTALPPGTRLTVVHPESADTFWSSQIAPSQLRKEVPQYSKPMNAPEGKVEGKAAPIEPHAQTKKAVPTEAKVPEANIAKPNEGKPPDSRPTIPEPRPPTPRPVRPPTPPAIRP